MDIILSSSLNDSVKANMLFKLLSDINAGKKYDAAKIYSLKALDYFTGKKNVVFYIQIAEPYGDAFLKQKNYDSALYVFKNSIELADQISESTMQKRLKAKNYSKAGKVFERVSYDSTLIYFLKSAEIYRSFQNNHDDSVFYVNAVSMAGYSYLMTGDPKKGYEIAEQAARMADALGDNKIKSLAYGVLGTILNELRLYDKAIPTLQIAAEAGIEAKDSSKAGACYNSIALVYLGQENFKDALKYYYKALEYINRNNSPGQYATICYNTIYVLCELDSVKSAEYFLAELTGNISNIQTDVNYFTTLIVICNYYIKKGNLTKADEYMQKATALLASFTSHDKLSEYYSIKSYLSETKGDYKKSLEDYKLYKAYEDSVSMSETQEMVAEKNTIYETEKKQQQITLLQKDNELKAANELRAKQVRNFSFVGIGALLIFGGFTYYRYKQRKQLSEKLSASLTELKQTQQQLIETERLREQENVRLRISRDIHDEIGANLTKISLLSEMLSSETKSNGSETKQSLEKISDYARTVNTSLSEIVWSVNPKQDTLESLVAYMRNYVHSFLQDTGINFKLDFPDEVANRQINPEFKRTIFLVLKETLNNCVKHSKAKNIDVKFHITDNHFEFAIKDDGAGFDMANKSAFGNGLNNMEYRVKQFGGDFKISSLPEKGCEIDVTGNLV
ncbi:MAG TPA: sensor histidine kinase [Bacteroidia bacterium]|nr:sensor histidine kinase [Bacteroidia bacterium]